MKWIALVAAPLFLAGCSVFGDRSGTEQVPFEVVEELGGDVEIRSYAERRAIETLMPLEDSGNNKGFRRLFGFITGSNTEQREISMTAPVQIDRVEDGRSMRFFMPKALVDIPAPEDPGLREVVIPARTEAVLRYSGRNGPEQLDAKAAELRDWLQASGYEIEGDPIGYFYDPPWTLPWARRHEVAFAVKDADS